MIHLSTSQRSKQHQDGPDSSSDGQREQRMHIRSLGTPCFTSLSSVLTCTAHNDNSGEAAFSDKHRWRIKKKKKTPFPEAP